MATYISFWSKYIENNKESKSVSSESIHKGPFKNDISALGGGGGKPNTDFCCRGGVGGSAKYWHADMTGGRVFM